MAEPLSIQEALIWVMVTTSAADRSVTDHEIESLSALTRRTPVFADFKVDIGKIGEKCALLLRDPNGIDLILDRIAEALPERFRETAYALAVEVAATDLSVPQEELVFLQMLEDRLELDKLGVAAIEHSARVRFRKLN